MFDRAALSLLVALTLSAAACSGNVDSAGTGGAAGSGGGGGAGGGCSLPAVECPAKAPFPGASCDLSESCQYPVGDGVNTWTYSCTAGRWAAQSTCEGAIGGGCPVPPLVEACDQPFDGSAAGATIEIGAADPTQPFQALKEGAELGLTWGGQGSPMVGYRIRVTGLDAGCIRADTTLSAAGKPGAPTPSTIALHCGGESLSVLSIFPLESVCEASPNAMVDLQIAIAVQGAGTVKKTFKVQNPGCMLPG
ncbi:MAG: hypothetical protein IT375_22535 [Polyangiaceae bacterium]|nr:hypothetical protein [Polyangiaceae bacterium]